MARTTTDQAAPAATVEKARDAVRDGLVSLSKATGDVETQLNTAADVAGEGVRVTSDALRRRSDATLALLGAFSVGLTTGFMLGGAHRLLTMVSLVPTALISGVILERLDRPRRLGAEGHQEADAPQQR